MSSGEDDDHDATDNDDDYEHVPVDFTVSFGVTPTALWHFLGCPHANETALRNTGKLVRWIFCQFQ